MPPIEAPWTESPWGQRERSPHTDILRCGDVESNPGPDPPPRRDGMDHVMVDVDNGERGEDVDLAHGALPHAQGLPACAAGTDEAGNPVVVRVAAPVALHPGVPPVPLQDLMALPAPTIHHLPQCLQSEWDRTLAATIDAYITLPSDGSLYALLALPKFVLTPPRVKWRHSKENTIACIKDRLGRFQAGDWAPLWADIAQYAPQNRVMTRSRASTQGDDFAKARRAKFLVGEGAPAKALQTLMSHGVHDPSDPAVHAKLVGLHPDSAPPDLSRLPAAVPDPVGALPEEEWRALVREAVRSFPRTSAPGPSGLRPTHLKDSLRRPGALSSVGGSPYILMPRLDRRYPPAVPRHLPLWGVPHGAEKEGRRGPPHCGR